MRSPTNPTCVSSIATLAIAAFVGLAGLSSLPAAPPVDGVVVFNEIMYHPADDGEASEWIELRNLMAVDVDLSGWRFSDGVDFVFPAGTVIRGDGYLVVAKDPASSGVPGALGPWTGSLNNAGERLRLVNNNDRLMDQVEYGDAGEWPVAPDGFGVSLAKRPGPRASHQASSWAASPRVGGTPGAVNVPEATGPVTSEVIGFHDVWKYTTAEPGANWTRRDFDDAGWSSGEGGFNFGGLGVYEEAPTGAISGAWDIARWTGDADSGISADKTYTHKIGFGRSGNYTAINGVTFDSPGGGVTAGANWALQGAGNHFTGNTTITLPAGSGSRQLAEEFYYGAGLAEGTSRLELRGLTPGTSYITTFYATGYGDREGRLMAITASDSGRVTQIDENGLGAGGGVLVTYWFIAPEDGRITYDFLPLEPGSTWHHYAFSNEVASALPVESEVLTGVTVADVSSERVNVNRHALNVLNGSGLNARQAHGLTANETMWLSNGTANSPNDPLPATITFDLGATLDLTAARIWNYNERSGSTDNTTRGSNEVEIQTAMAPGGPFTTVGTIALRRAFGITSEIGQRVPLAARARYVRLNILSNHGGASQYAGLSEVRFYREASTGQGVPVAKHAPIATLFATGVGDDGVPLPSGQVDPHYTKVSGPGGASVLAVTPHPAWLGADGRSQWIGPNADGSSNIPAGTYVYRTTFDLAGYAAASAQVRFEVAADNSLDGVTLNGVAQIGLTAEGFAAFNGPLTLTGPFNPGLNTLEFAWNNASTSPNPGAVRLRFDATAESTLARTTLSANPVTSYFRKNFTLGGLAGSTYTATFEHASNDGLVVYLNGTEVYRHNLPEGEITASTLATAVVPYPMLSGAITLPATALTSGENTLAVELHQAAASDPDAYFGGTLVVTTYPPAEETMTLAITELSGAAEAGEGFVEITNRGAAAAVLDGMSVRGSNGLRYTFPAGTTLAAGASVVVTEGQWGGRPAEGDRVGLFSADGLTVFSAVAARVDTRALTATGGWITPAAATPGAANVFAPLKKIVINEIMYHHAPAYQPSGTVENDEEWIELHNVEATAQSLTGWRLRGAADYDFPAGTEIPAGGYLVVTGDAAGLAAKYPGIAVLGNWSGSLPNSDGVVRLEDHTGQTQCEVRYHDGGRWHEAADGGGSSLELLHPEMDPALPESWAASDESAKAEWVNIDYTASGASPSGSNDPTSYHEFILGLLDAGEVLIDDVSVEEVNQGNRQLIQNGDFAGSSADKWRLLGNHGGHRRSVVVPDPDAPSNPVLKVVATGAAEHMHNHAETTLKAGNTFVNLSSSGSYRIRLRARWVSGSPRLHTRLYFNRAARQHVLPIPERIGTPGTANSRRLAAPLPSLQGLSHTPAVPSPSAPVQVSVRATAPGGVADVTLHWRPDGEAWRQVAMVSAGDGHYTAGLPGQSGGSLVQFYVEATGANGQRATFPAAGPDSRALIPWDDGTPRPTPGHSFRILLPVADANFLHAAVNVMSNDALPCTVIYRDTDVFYDAAVSLKSSQRGRLSDGRVGFAVDFDPANRFRGTNPSVNLDRSSIGRGATGSGFGQNELLNWQLMNRAGGIPAMYNDMVYALPPRAAHRGSASLTMAEFNDVYLDSQYASGNDGPTFKYELIYYPTTTSDGTREGLKLPQPDDVRGVNLSSINTPTNKESYRWNFLITNARKNDDYSRMIAFSQAFRLNGTAFINAVRDVVDVDVYLRASAAMTLCGVVDHYSDGSQHNWKFYARPSDGRIVYLPWDHDFLSASVNTGLVRQPDLQKLLSARPEWNRAFYGHLRDIIQTSVNAAYLNPWTTHYQAFLTGGNLGEVRDYLLARATFALGQVPVALTNATFAITTNGGEPFSTADSSATLAGTGAVDVRSLRLAGAATTLPLEWTSNTAWRTTVPVQPGENALVLEALNYQGEVIATQTIVITGTGAVVPASAASIVIAEVHYHPLDPTAAETAAGVLEADDFEFVELLNIGDVPVDLSGCRFTAGIDYAFPAGTTLVAGGRLIVPRRAMAFALRYPGVTTVADYYDAAGNKLANSGEELALTDASGQNIKRFEYSDDAPWPTAADGDGPSLTLIAPWTNPDHTQPLNWRASVAPHGSPGAGDALPAPAQPLADADGNGLADQLDYLFGAGALPGIEPVSGQIRLERDLRADAILSVEWSADLTNWHALPLSTADRAALEGSLERLSFPRPESAPASGYFIRVQTPVAP